MKSKTLKGKAEPPSELEKTPDEKVVVVVVDVNT